MRHVFVSCVRLMPQRVCTGMLRKLWTIWQHVSACLGGGGWSRPAAGAGWMAETVRRLLADMWQNYTSGEHSKHIHTNACFRLAGLHLVNECWKLAIPLRKAACSSETMVATRFRNVAVARISCRKCYWRSIIYRRLAVNAMQESKYWFFLYEHLHRRFAVFCVAL